MDGNGSATYAYAAVMRAPGWSRWACVAAGSRLADAMAPLALLLLGHATTGSFVVGGIAAGAHAFAEAVAAPMLGARCDRSASPARHLSRMLVIRALCYVLIALCASSIPAVAQIALAATAGAVGAGVQGGLRSILAGRTASRRHQQAFSLDTVLLELCWTAAPAATSGLTLFAAPEAAVLVMAGTTLLAAIAARRMRLRHAPTATPTNASTDWRALSPAATTLGLGLVAGTVGGTLDTATPPRLADIGADPALTGFLFAGYSVASVLGGLTYGLRAWPGTSQRQASVLLVLLPLTLLPAALSDSLPVVAVATVTAGLFAAPLITTRSLAVQERVPNTHLGAGFASLYAVNGAGYGLAGFIVAAILPLGATPAYALPLVTAAGVGVVSFSLHDRTRALLRRRRA